MPISRIGTDGIDQTSSQQIGGISVGRGGGAVATNTAVGASALAVNTTGAHNLAVGYQTLQANTTANQNTAVGSQAAYSNTTGSSLEAFGYQALYSNTTGNYNSAFGFYALQQNTTGSRNSAFSRGALAANTTGSNNVSMGVSSLNANTTGSYNTALGDSALGNSTTASNNTAVGYQAGVSNTTGALNVFVGPTAGLQNTTGTYNVAIGGGSSGVAWSALQENRSSSYNTMVGVGAGGQYNSSVGLNTFIGFYAGNAITSGSKNTIVGRYDGNQNGLDIRTANNNIVLSDGDGVPRIWVDGYGNNHFGNPGTNTTPAFNSGGSDPAHTIGNMSSYPNTASRLNIQERAGNWITFVNGSGTNYGVISVNGSGVTYGSNSDYRLKENVQPVANALAKVMALKPVSYEWIVDKSYAEGFLAHELQEVLPFAVKGTKDETYEVGQVLDADGNVISENTNRPEGEMLYGETWIKTGDEPKYQSIDTSHIIATLTAAIQELKAEFDAYKEAHP